MENEIMKRGDGDCELTCCICGKRDKLVQTAFRNQGGLVIGYLFACNKQCFDYLQKRDDYRAGHRTHEDVENDGAR